MTWSRIKIPSTMRIDSCPLDKMFFILKSYGFVSTIIIPDSIRPDLIPSRLAEKILHVSYKCKYQMFLFARRVHQSRATASGSQPTGLYDAYVFPVSILIYNPLQNRSCGKLRTLLRPLQKKARICRGRYKRLRLFHRFRRVPASCRECVRLCNSPFLANLHGRRLPLGFAIIQQDRNTVCRRNANAATRFLCD